MPAGEVERPAAATWGGTRLARRARGADEDGLLKYLDEQRHGLANQGWKDSGDSVRFADGRIADAPIALCEVQGYAVRGGAEAAAALLDALRRGRAADGLAGVGGRAARAVPRPVLGRGRRRAATSAIALDGHGRRVDAVTSNIGHLLGTGLLDARRGRPGRGDA